MIMMTNLRRIMRDQKGATAVEYGLILALIVLAMLGAASNMAGGTTSLWAKVENKVVR
jgi:pilus assembly protein Flp/PilA